ncbi:MAG: rRNA pseudouridine synthase [Sandaracinus sp.]|nr:rRNA pseudouridine synthase [Sandaracinus sp.]
MALERLQKVIARAGIASRRQSEELITSGRVRVNGRIVTELGTQVDGRRDKVEVDGRRIVAEKPAYYVYHKPRLVVSTLHDPEGRPCLDEVVKKLPEQVHAVGRLDFHTSGVLLLTNDGELTEALLRPTTKVPKVYVAKLQGNVDVPELDRLRNGVTLDDGYVTKPAKVYVERSEPNATWVNITLHEGKNRQIHRMGEALGRRVMRLVRLSFADLTAEGLRPGMLRPLKKTEVDKLMDRYVIPHRRRKAKRAGKPFDPR